MIAVRSEDWPGTVSTVRLWALVVVTSSASLRISLSAAVVLQV